MFTSSSGCFRRLSLHPLSPLSFRHHHHHHIHFTLFRLYSSVIGSVAKPASSANISARINQTPRLLKPITPDIKVTSKPKSKKKKQENAQQSSFDGYLFIHYRLVLLHHIAYDIPRTVNGYLPVYSDYKHNDSQHWVIIRKVKGNVQVLQKRMIYKMDDMWEDREETRGSDVFKI